MRAYFDVPEIEGEEDYDDDDLLSTMHHPAPNHIRPDIDSMRVVHKGLMGKEWWQER